MSRLAPVSWLWACVAILAGGCADNAMVLKGRLSEAAKQQTAMSHQNQQLQDRVNSLSRDNENKDVLLAQAQQQTKVSEDQLGLLREQLRSTTSQLAQLRAFCTTQGWTITREYTDQAGGKKTACDIRCDNFVMLGRMEDGNRDSGGYGGKAVGSGSQDFEDHGAPSPAAGNSFPDDDIPF